ncbi:MAG: universal stress protein [Desulfobacterales bacterium]|nr:universal stress protein [Desulfobacterales bacterium]
MIKRILVGLGGTPYTAVAVKRAVELAQIHEAIVTGVTILDMNRLQKVGPVPLGGAAYANKLVQNRIDVTRGCVAESVAYFEKACSDAGLTYSTIQETGDPFDQMISHVRYHDLTLFGVKSLFDCGITLEPKDALVRLVSQGVRPILAVSPQYREVRKALIAYSGSMESAKAMRRFIQMRLWPDLRITLAHFSKDIGKGEALLQDAARYCRAHGHETDTLMVEGDAKTGVLAQAQSSGADIIVMGNGSRKLMLRQFLGDTVLTTIENADRPLFLSQ